MIIRYKSALILPIILALFVVLPAFASTPTPKPKDQVKVNVSSAALRTGPGFSYSSARYVYLGDVLTVYGVNADSSWYEVDRENELWIASIQVIPENGSLSNQVIQNIITTTQKTPSNDVMTDSNGLMDSNIQDTDSQKLPFIDLVKNLDLPEWIILEKIKWPVWLNWEFAKQLVQDMPDWVKTGLKIWLFTLGLLLLTFRFRWFFGALVFGLFLGPVGWVIDIYILIRLVFTRDYMNDYSPKELWEDILGSWPVVAVSVTIFLALTAVSYVGGIIVFAYLLTFVGIIKVFLPGPRYSQVIHQSNSSYSPSSNDDSSYSRSDYERDRAYSDAIYNSDDGADKDGDKPDKDPFFHGWLD